MDRKQRAAINRQNATKSTGPKTDAGKNVSSMNNLKHGLCTRRPFLADGSTDYDAYFAIEESYLNDYAPETHAELETVISMIETQWQLTRVRRLLDLAYLKGGDLYQTSKMMDNYSRHQTRLHRLYNELLVRIKALVAERDPKNPGLNPQQLAALIASKPPRNRPFDIEPPVTPERPPFNPYEKKDLSENGFVLNEEKQPATSAPYTATATAKSPHTAAATAKKDAA